MNKNRLNKLTQELKANSLDGLALVPGPNMIYLSGISSHVSERPIILFVMADAEPVIIIPTLEAMKAQAAGIPEERILGWTDDGGYTNAFQQASDMLALSSKTMGVEALHMRVLELEALQTFAPGMKTKHAEPIMAALRGVKDADEIAAMEKAIAVAEKALHHILPRIKVGMTEKKVATMLTQALFDGGADSIAFGPIVSAGPNSASPHAVPTERPLQSGDLLVIDWGVFVDGYPSDITRTFAVGEIEPEFEHIYNIVRESNAQGRKISAPGVSGQAVDAAAREVIEDTGYGPYFIHRTGHGLGLEVHEEPNMVVGNTTPLVVGNVFTVEPGIYLPGRGGVRIEDDLVITADGHRCLTTFTKELITIGL